MDKLIKKKIKRKIVIDNISWGGLPFYQYDLEEYLNRKLSEKDRKRAFSISPDSLREYRLLWKSIPHGLKLTLQAGILIPVSLTGFFRALSMPDLDIKLLGIGWHRYFLFHSSLGLWVLKEFFNTYNEFTEKGDCSNITGKIFGAIGAGGAAGIGLHLLKDGAFGYFEGEKSVVFGFPGIFKRNTIIRGTFLDDNLWLLGNSLWAFKISKDIFVIAFGKEIEDVKKFVKEYFNRENEKKS